MTVLPERETLDEILAASLSHEMKTPLAAIEAATAGLRKSLELLVGVVQAENPSPDLLRETLPLISSALADRHLEPPATGPKALERAAKIAARLAAAGLRESAEEAASAIVKGGWEPRLDDIELVLVKWGAPRVLPLLVAVGRIRSSLRSMEASTSRLSGLVAAVRVGLGPQEMTLGPVNVRHCIDDALATLRHAIPPGVEIETRCEASLTISGNATQIEQVVTNLVGNALGAVGEKDGRILVEAERSEGDAVLRVEDNGHGIPDAMRPRIFTPFFTSMEAGKGTGLGLYISRRIVENHGGTLTFTSVPGRTCFTARIPRSGPRPAASSAGGA